MNQVIAIVAMAVLVLSSTIVLSEAAGFTDSGSPEKHVSRDRTPSAPTLLSPSFGKNAVTLTWSAPSNNGGSSITNYKVYRGKSSGGETLLTTVGNVRTYTNSGLATGQSYYYTISAVNSGGEGLQSNELVATPVSSPSAPLINQPTSSNGQVAVSWGAPTADGGASITSYRVYRGTSSGSEALLATVGAVLGYTDTGLINGQTYYYQASAVNSVGEGNRSSEVSAVPMTIPSAPVLVSAVPGDGQVALTWTAPTSNAGSPVTNYEVFRGTATGAEAFLAMIGNILTYNDSGLSNGQMYYYKVLARNSVGVSVLSNELGATPMTVPTSPSFASAKAGNAQADLTWLAPSNNGGSAIIGYKVYRGTVSGEESPLATLGNTLAYTSTGLVNGQTYYFRISAINSVGEGPLSNEMSVMPAKVPPAPTLVSATPANSLVALAWNAPASDGGSEIVGYKVYRGVVSDSEALLATVGDVLAYSDSGLMNGQRYFYRISAVNLEGEGAQSNEMSATPSTIPTAPTLNSAAAGSATATLSWSSPSSNGGLPILNYTVYRGTASGSEAVLTTLGNVLSFTDAGLSNGQTYYYCISASNANGEGPRSSELSTTPMVALPTAPSLVSATPGDGQVVLVWNAPSATDGGDVTAYLLYRGGSSGGETLLATLGNVLTYSDSGLANGQAYYYQVSAVNPAGESPRSGELSAIPATVPGAPTLTSASSGNAQAALAWNAPGTNCGSAIANYKIYRGTASGGETLLATIGNFLTWADTGLTNGQAYFYKVSAVNAKGEGALSNEMTVTPMTVPSSPSTLSAVPGNSQMVLTWSAPSSNGGSSISGYKFYRGTSPGGETLLATLGNVLTFTDGGLTNGQAYYYTVSAVNAAGEGAYSNEAYSTPATVPSAPTTSSPISGNAQIVLTWTAPNSNGGSAISGYKIYRGSAAGGETLLSSLGNVLTFTNTGLTNGQTYYYKVSAVNSVGEGLQSNEVSSTPMAPPSAPTSLVASAGNAQVTLTWAAPSSNGGVAVRNYNVYRGTAAGSETLQVSLGNVLTFTDTGLTNGQTYFYKVSAMNSVGEGPLSSEASSTPATVPSAPTMSSAVPGNAQVVLTWAAPSSNGGSSVSGYKIYRGSAAGGETLQATLGNVLTYSNTGLTNGQTYYFKVSAINSLGEGPQSNEVSSTPASTPSSPLSLAASAGSAQVTLTWAAPSSNGGAAITSYKIYRGTSTGGEAFLVSLGNVLTYTDTGLTNGQTYYYKVSAVNSVGEGPLSSEASAKPVSALTVPSAPAITSAGAGDGKIVLAWTAPSSNGGAAITNYKVYRGTASGGEAILATIGNVLTYTDTGLTNGKAYYYKVSAVNSVGEGPTSNEMSGVPASSVVPAKYTVSVSGSNYVVKDGSGTSVYTNANAATAINKAIGLLTQGRTSKEKVLLQGNFTLTTAIQVTSYTILELNGKVTVGASTNNHAVSASSKCFIDIQGGEWDGNQVNNPYGGGERDAFYFDSCHNITIQNLKVHDCPYGNIEFDISKYITIFNVESYNSGNLTRGAAWIGLSIILSNTSNSLIDSCHIHDSAKGGVYFYCEDEPSLGLPDVPEKINYNTMRNNLVERTQCSGLSLSIRGMTDHASYGLIENNTCIDCGLDGMHPGINIGWNDDNGLRLADNCTVRNNRIYETGRFYPPAGTGTGGGMNICSDDSVITNNTIYNTTDFGISVMGDRNTISYNQISGVKTSCYPGILLQDASNNEIVHNTITNCPSAVMIYAGPVTNACNNNHVAYNHFASIANYMAFIHDKTCVGNIYEYNTYQGSWSVYNNGTGTIIRNNTVG